MSVFRNCHAQEMSQANCHASFSDSKQLLKKYSSVDVSVAKRYSQCLHQVVHGMNEYAYLLKQRSQQNPFAHNHQHAVSRCWQQSAS